MTIRVAVFNDFEVIVAGLVGMLEEFDDLEVVGVGVGGDDRTLHQTADVVLYDTYGRAGIPWGEISELIAQPTARHVVLFTFSLDDHVVSHALDAGAHGCLWKGLSRQELADAIRRVAAGEVVVSDADGRPRTPAEGHRWPFDDLGLTARESEVLALLSEGLPNARIAEALYLSTETVRSHVKQIFKKLGAHTRSEATAKALRAGAFSRR